MQLSKMSVMKYASSSAYVFKTFKITTVISHNESAIAATSPKFELARKTQSQLVLCVCVSRWQNMIFPFSGAYQLRRRLLTRKSSLKTGRRTLDAVYQAHPGPPFASILMHYTRQSGSFNVQFACSTVIKLLKCALSRQQSPRT